MPEFLRDLPRFDFTHAPPTTREQWGQADVIYGAKSVVDAIERAGKRVRSAGPDQPKRAK